jgi:hypothetical protein
MNPFFLLAADVLVAVLLVTSIISSIVLSRRISNLKSNETAMRQTIGELITSTVTAERAIAGLRGALSECDHGLAERLRAAEQSSADLAFKVEAGENIMDRMTHLAEVTRQAALANLVPHIVSAPVVKPPPTQSERLEAAAQAAQAMTERALKRMERKAA